MTLLFIQPGSLKMPFTIDGEIKGEGRFELNSITVANLVSLLRKLLAKHAMMVLQVQELGSKLV